MSTAQSDEPLMTVKDYWNHSDDRLTELVRGRVVPLPWPEPTHGLVHANVGCQLAGYLKTCDVGTAVMGVGIITTRDPDTVRGADVSFYSYERIPKGKMPHGWPEEAPEFVFEIRSRDDRAGALLERAGEYFNAGTSCVSIIDPRRRHVVTFSDDYLATVFGEDDRLNLPYPLSGWRPRVSDFLQE